MIPQQILDTLERLIVACQHPDIDSVYRYGPEQSIGIVFHSQARAFIWPSEKPGKPAELPAEPQEYRHRVQYVLSLLSDLLDVVKPDGVQWRTVGVDGTHLSPCGLEIRAGQTRMLLQVTAGGAPAKDTDPASFADWRIPEGIS